MITNFDPNIEISKIFSGKLRRYAHLKWYEHILLPKHMLLNLRDFILVAIGTLQSLIKLTIWRPDVLFAKGGYVCLPVGVAAKILSIPIVIHDSDAHPGLTNRILSKWSKYIATGAPTEYYDYPESKTFYVGVPISDMFKIYNNDDQLEAKKRWGVDTKRPLLVVTGGGLGAQKINLAFAEILDDLLKKYSIIIISGSANYDTMRSLLPENNNYFQLHPFVSDEIVNLFCAADLVITRAGATTILELSAMAKPTILIPNPRLTGNHQQKNANIYATAGAVEVITETAINNNPKNLLNLINHIMNDKIKLSKMAKNFHEFAKPNAAKNVANIIIKTYSEKYDKK